MDKLTIAPNPNWFAQNVCYCTPDNGLIYAATSKIVFIPPKIENEDNGIKILDLKKKLHSFALCPSYKQTKRLAIINGDFHVLVYNFETGNAEQGHKGHHRHEHDESNKQNQFTSIIFASNNVILSSVNSDIIKFCLLTNTFNTYPDFSNRNSITIMKTSTNDPNLMAAGTKNGLILLIDVDRMEIRTRLRGHDMEITSLDFQYLRSKENAKKKQNAQASNKDDDDIFDIYSYEKVENEFGVYQESTADQSDYEETNEAALNEKVHTTSDFNFLEACNNLKEQILSNDSNNLSNSNNKKTTYEDNKEQYGVKNEENPSVDLSIESNPSSHTPVLTEESLNYLEECQRMQDFAPEQNQYDSNKVTVLASGSRECVVYLWDISEHTVLDKIKWHPKAKSQLLPTTFTNVLWMSHETLLITDNNGDINEYKVKFDTKKKSISDQHQKKTFDVKGALNMCKSVDSSVLWVSSIHRHICCFETQAYSKIVSLDTLQIRIHYIEENPIDSHVIAIAGNDKRLCLWNTSEVNHHFISLKPFMNKIHSCILCVSWHPIKDNILAFSTREGRIGVLDVNKYSNVPVILESFSPNEIYSIKWAKFCDSNDSEKIILIACSNGKLAYYTYHDFKIHPLNQFKQVCSIITKNNLIAIGTNTGSLLICDMAKDFQIITEFKICRKYIGMMTWHASKNILAIASETGITLINDINETTKLTEENLVKIPHQKRIYSVRFNRSGDRLVSSCMNGNVSVWNIETLTLLSTINIETPAYSAIFMPNNERMIICGGQDSTIQVYEWEKYFVSNGEVAVVTDKSKNLKFEDKIKSLNWGSEIMTITKHNKKRIKKKAHAKEANKNVNEITSEIGKIKITSKKMSSIFHAANREITVDPLKFIEMLLKENAEREPTLNERMFGERADIICVMEKELALESPKSISAIIFPQLMDNLKDDILERITTKTLTETHIAIAPSVSYDLWRKCCFAFGNQCIESEEFIRSVPYLLAVNDIDSCINHLTESKFYREAWIIAKMRKDDKDPVFERIFTKWIAFYDSSGSYEAAAALFCIKKNYKRAYELLEKRQNKDEKFNEIFNLIATKL